jgi:diaminohydroxyphosphoribosylaminopyrimidine deaminase/5-amino-6-(5-phosphoribosylamino)uracil reductase
LILKKIYLLGCRNLLVEGGTIITNQFLKKRLFNRFYLFKSKKILSKLVEYKEFTGLKDLKKNYKDRLNLKAKFGKDSITLYKN